MMMNTTNGDTMASTTPAVRVPDASIALRDTLRLLTTATDENDLEYLYDELYVWCSSWDQATALYRAHRRGVYVPGL